MQFSFDINAFLAKLDEYTEKKIKYTRDCPMSTLTTFKIGGPCAAAVFPDNASELAYAAECAYELGVLPKIIGRGSNLLCSDDGYDGIVIVSDNADAIKINGELVECECGASLTAAANEAHEASLEGAEFMYGIPGTIGGGVFMNAGAYGGQMSDVVVRVECLNVKTKERFSLSGDELDFSYRHSAFTSRRDYIVLGAALKLRQGNKEEIGARMRDFITRRREKQPLEYPSAGSTFKRCEGRFTAQLIDEAGLKGMRVGNAAVSEKHAGFIINLGGASASDVLSLVDKIKAEIYKKYGLNIECEVEYLG